MGDKKFGKSLKKMLSSRKIRYGSNSFILTIIVLAIAVVINMLAGMSTLKVDLTPGKLYSISSTTKDILKKLDKDIAIYGLFDNGKVGNDDSMKEITRLLEQYERYSKSRVKVHYVDPDKDPTFLNKFDSDGSKGISKGNFIVASGKKTKVVSSYDLYEIQSDQYGQQSITGIKAEESFTGAIKYVSADKTPSVYFVEGHDEISLSNFSSFKGYLEKNNYEVKTLNLIVTDKIPDDAEILIVPSPKKDLTGAEKERVISYLNNGGKIVFLFDSMDLGIDFVQFGEILKGYNLSLNNDRIKENNSQRHIPNEPYEILPDLQYNDINIVLDPEKFAMIMPKSRSLNILKDSKKYLNVIQLLKSSSQAVGEQVDASKGKDIPGPLDMAVAVENKSGSKPSKILVIGNASFITDDAISRYQQLSVNGMYFFLNALNWMQEKKNDVIIEPKSFDNSVLNLTASQANVIVIVILILLPLAIFATGTVIWLRRRHL